MVKKKSSVYNIINIATDILLANCAYIFSLYVWLELFHNDATNIAQNLNILIVYSCMMLLFYRISTLYNQTLFQTFTHEVLKIIQINIIGILALGLIFYVFRLENFSRGVLAYLFLFSTTFIILKRYIFRLILKKYPHLARNTINVLVIGNGNLAKRFMKNAKNSTQYDFTLAGYICDSEVASCEKKIGTYSDLEDILSTKPIDQVVIALDATEVGSHITHIIQTCDKLGTKVYIIPIYNDFFPTAPEINTIGDTKLLNMRTIPLDNSFNAIQKRSFDIIMSLIFIIISSPIMLITALLVKLTSPGPIVFKQERVGRTKKLFTMYKFRSMKVNNESTTAWSKDADPRKTWFGSLIRKTSVDELLQFFNVLKGHMSIVGPRPEIPYYVEQFKETIPLYMLKHQVRPGITGWAQVNGLRGDTSIEDRIKYDLWYIENWNILLDIKIIIMTVFVAINSEKIRKKK